MTSSILALIKIPVVLFVSFCLLLTFSISRAFAAKKEAYDIIYIRSNDLGKVLDYKENLESVFDAKVTKKLKIAGRGREYALIYDGNLSSRTVTKTLISHAQLLSDAGFNEPYASEENKFDPLFNVSYGIGPNLDSLKEKYQVLQAYLGEDVKRDLFIEQTDSDNYVIVYRFRGDEASTIRVAKQHATLLKAKKILITPIPQQASRGAGGVDL